MERIAEGQDERINEPTAASGLIPSPQPSPGGRGGKKGCPPWLIAFFVFLPPFHRKFEEMG